MEKYWLLFCSRPREEHQTKFFPKIIKTFQQIGDDKLNKLMGWETSLHLSAFLFRGGTAAAPDQNHCLKLTILQLIVTRFLWEMR